jgi:integrase
MVKHSKESALSPREFELLLEGAERIEKDRQRIEAKFGILVAGRLGLRVGEIIHMTEDWINWRQRRIEIPRQMDCHLGRDDGPCGYCQQLAIQMVDVYDAEDPDGMSNARERFINRHLERSWSAGDELTLDDVLQMRWFAKTEAASRDVPFSHDARTELVIERFFEDREKYGMSKSAFDRRLNKALGLADEIDQDTTMPHGLRATAATRLAAQNADPLTLKSMLGWASFQTAKNYISGSPNRTERMLQQIHSV